MAHSPYERYHEAPATVLQVTGKYTLTRGYWERGWPWYKIPQMCATVVKMIEETKYGAFLQSLLSKTFEYVYVYMYISISWLPLVTLSSHYTKQCIHSINGHQKPHKSNRAWFVVVQLDKVKSR